MRACGLAIVLAGCTNGSGSWQLEVSDEVCPPRTTAPAYEVPIDAVAWNGTDYVAAWTRIWGDGLPNGEFSDVVVGRVTADGQLRDVFGIPITTSLPKQTGTKLAAAPDGEVLIGFWEGEPFLGVNKPLLVARASPDGGVR